MKRYAWFVFLLVPLLSGCVTETVGQPDMNADRRTELARARTALGADYYQRKQYAVALEQLDLAMQADPGYSPAYGVRALVHIALLEDKEAEDDFKRSLDLDAKNSETHDNYGWFLCQRGRERAGIAQHLAAAKDPLYSGQAAAYMRAGECAMKIGDLTNSELYFEKAQILQPELAQVSFDMAQLSYITGDYITARTKFAAFRKAVNDRLSAEHLLLGVRIEHKLGDRGAEAALAARLRRSYPDSREAQSLGQIR
jgi:type IV pilus assembly protein PilF